MKYMLLIYTDPALEPAYGSPEFQSMMGAYHGVNEAMKADGVLLEGDALQGTESATSLRLRGGKAETMDGPFATTKEHLGGYYTIDVPDLDAALRYAAMIPSAAYGTIEVRPLMNYNPSA